MSSERRRYQANLHERYGDQRAALFREVHSWLGPQSVDRIGRQVATYAADYRRLHECGPSRSEVLGQLAVLEQLAPILEVVPAGYQRILRQAAADLILNACRARGWIAFSHQAHSLNIGPRYRVKSRLRRNNHPATPEPAKVCPPGQ